MITSSVRFSHDVLVHLKKGTDTSDLLNFNIDPPLWPRNRKVAILEAFSWFLGPKIAFCGFLAKKGVNIKVKEIWSISAILEVY